MNGRVRIDFAARPGRLDPARAGIAVLLLAAGAGAAALLPYRSAALALESVVRQEEALRRQIERGRPRAASSLAPAAIAAANQAITRLNLPWPEIFQIFEAAALPNVALLAIEPDSHRRLLRVSAEAKGPEDMVEFLEALADAGRLAELSLSRYEINERDANRPVRFVLEAAWRESE